MEKEKISVLEMCGDLQDFKGKFYLKVYEKIEGKMQPLLVKVDDLVKIAIGKNHQEENI